MLPARHLLGRAYSVFNYGVSSLTMLKNGDFPYWNEDGLHGAATGTAFHYSQALGRTFVIIMLGTNDSKPQNWAYKADFL